jgi:hypothetical protein
MSEIIDKVNDLLAGGGLFKVHDITSVNFKPHPYCITPRHVEIAADYHSGMLNEAAIRDAEQRGVKCGMYVNQYNPKQCSSNPHERWPRCNLSRKEHTSDRVCFLDLLRDMTNKEAQEELKKIVGLCDENKIDGFAFVESGFKFKKEGEEHERPVCSSD